MINRFKELMHVKEAIDNLTKKTSELEVAARVQQDQAKKLREELEDTFKENRKAVSHAKKDIENLSDFQKELSKELYEFKLFKKELRKEIMKKVETELSQTKNIMKNEVQGFNDAKKKIDLKFKSVDQLDSEIKKLVDITKNLKACDFELAKYKKETEKSEKEKSDLLRKIDSLQRLVARRRR